MDDAIKSIKPTSRDPCVLRFFGELEKSKDFRATAWKIRLTIRELEGFRNHIRMLQQLVQVQTAIQGNLYKSDLKNIEAPANEATTVDPCVNRFIEDLYRSNDFATTIDSVGSTIRELMVLYDDILRMQERVPSCRQATESVETDDDHKTLPDGEVVYPDGEVAPSPNSSV